MQPQLSEVKQNKSRTNDWVVWMREKDFYFGDGQCGITTGEAKKAVGSSIECCKYLLLWYYLPMLLARGIPHSTQC